MAKTYNLTQLDAIAGGSSEFINEMVLVFVSEIPSQVNDLVEALNSKDYIALGGFAHKIKPTLDLMGVNSFTSEIRLLEKYGKNLENINEIPDLVERLKAVTESVISEMKIEFEIE